MIRVSNKTKSKNYHITIFTYTVLTGLGIFPGKSKILMIEGLGHGL